MKNFKDWSGQLSEGDDAGWDEIQAMINDFEAFERHIGDPANIEAMKKAAEANAETKTGQMMKLLINALPQKAGPLMAAMDKLNDYVVFVNKND